MSLATYLLANQITDVEGNSGEIADQTRTLGTLCDSPSVQRILEIGFNAGHSADTFLSHSLAHVVSFDLNDHGYVLHAKKYMDQKYPTRHTLLLGDSAQTIPAYHKEHPEERFDLIYIDGGHAYEEAYADLLNCRALAHPQTMVVMDDVVLSTNHQRGWSVGPSKVWAEAVLQGVIRDSCGELYGPGRGMCWGYYVM